MTPEWIRLTRLDDQAKHFQVWHIISIGPCEEGSLIRAFGAALEAVRETPDEIMALLGVDARPAQTAPQPPNARSASEPQVAGADPPWLDEAAFIAEFAFLHDPSLETSWSAVVRAVHAFIAAQPPSVAEIECGSFLHRDPTAKCIRKPQIYSRHASRSGEGEGTEMTEADARLLAAIRAREAHFQRWMGPDGCANQSQRDRQFLLRLLDEAQREAARFDWLVRTKFIWLLYEGSAEMVRAAIDAKMLCKAEAKDSQK